MLRSLRAAALGLLTAGGALAAAAAPAPALVTADRWPSIAGADSGEHAWDRVLDEPRRSGPIAGAAAAGRTLRAPDGTSVRVADAAGVSREVEQWYVDVLGGLPHGAELGRLRVRIVPTARLGSDAECGGGSDVLACYVSGTSTMIVPADGASSAAAGVTLDYVLTHEYGHHVANHRRNPPFRAVAFGPKRWASYERVCSAALRGRYAVRDERVAYLRSPGENWAETYARLTRPNVSWSFDPTLKPTSAALTAARSDVDEPWTRPAVARFAGRLDLPQTSRTHRFTLRLDGALALRLRPPPGADYDLRVRAGGRVVGSTLGRGAADTLSFEAACRTSASEPVTVEVLRRDGAGDYELDVTYAG